MPTFKFYNIQLLPLDTQSTQEAGIDGYQTLFTSLRTAAGEAFRNRHIETVFEPLRGESYFGPFSVRIASKQYAFGELGRFTRVESIQDLYTGEEELKVPPGSGSDRRVFTFLFDFNLHVMALQQTQGLPSSSVVTRALDAMLTRHIKGALQPYVLTVTELTDAASLDRVFDADAYEKVEIDVTFSNSAEFDDDVLSQVENDFKEKNIHNVHHEERPASGSAMNSLSDMSAPLIRLAAKYGNADVTYVRDDRTHRYKMRDFPVTLRVKALRASEHVGRLWSDIQSAIVNAVSRAHSGSTTDRALRRDDEGDC